jgi:hypothetical protein
VTEEPHENFVAKNLDATLRSISGKIKIALVQKMCTQYLHSMNNIAMKHLVPIVFLAFGLSLIQIRIACI